jgi:Ulp1 family protease
MHIKCELFQSPSCVSRGSLTTTSIYQGRSASGVLIDVSRKDSRTLKTGGCLNDTIIEVMIGYEIGSDQAYCHTDQLDRILYEWCKERSPELASDIHLFNTYLYKIISDP